MPCGRRAQPDAAEQPVEHRAERGIARPLVLGAVADELLAHGARRVEVVALAEQGHADAAGARDRARVGLLERRR